VIRFLLDSEEDLELGRLRALADNAAAQVARERERRQVAEDKIAAAAAMAAEAQVHRLLLLSSRHDLSLMPSPYSLVLALVCRATRRRPCCIVKAQSSGCNFFPKL
jgi:hypothetical protein